MLVKTCQTPPTPPVVGILPCPEMQTREPACSHTNAPICCQDKTDSGPQSQSQARLAPLAQVRLIPHIKEEVEVTDLSLQSCSG